MCNVSKIIFVTFAPKEKKVRQKNIIKKKRATIKLNLRIHLKINLKIHLKVYPRICQRYNL